jgi:hypothetical protein
LDTTFDPNRYGPVLAGLLDTDRRRSLGEGTGNAELSRALDDISIETAFGHATLRNRNAALACIGGLWLLADELDTSHSISQHLDTPEGSFWHGIMHRREGDFGNAKYWFRRVGDHAIFEPLGQRAWEFDALGTGNPWELGRFVDACQAAQQDEQLASACREVQQIEWELLFDHCYRQAVDR